MRPEEPFLVEGYSAWADAEEALLAFLDDLGATPAACTTTVRLLPVPIDNAESFGGWLDRRTAADGAWTYVTTAANEQGERFGYALPVRDSTPPDAAWMFPFVEIHTVAISWWLVTAWRVRQLAGAGRSLYSAGQFIAAAACVRPLVETAAALWVDGAKFTVAWDEIKRSGPPTSDVEALRRQQAIRDVLYEVTWGSKFDDRAGEWQRLSQSIPRTNVLGHIQKLGKVTPGDLQTDYQWLCNTVHPSLGNTLAFSTPPFSHSTRTHVLNMMSGHPLFVESDAGVQSERRIQRAVVGSAASSATTLLATMDALLRVIDDIGLTTGAAEIGRERYWRALRRVPRNARCPCRSGAKWKHCVHAWGLPAPRMPISFSAPTGT